VTLASLTIQLLNGLASASAPVSGCGRIDADLRRHRIVNLRMARSSCSARMSRIRLQRMDGEFRLRCDWLLGRRPRCRAMRRHAGRVDRNARSETTLWCAGAPPAYGDVRRRADRARRRARVLGTRRSAGTARARTRRNVRDSRPRRSPVRPVSDRPRSACADRAHVARDGTRFGIVIARHRRIAC
jgi:hypothetical protein